MIITDSSWHFSSRAPSFSKSHPVVEGDENDQNPVHYETENMMLTTMSIVANILIQTMQTSKCIMVQVVGVSPETGEVIRSRVRNLEELKVL